MSTAEAPGYLGHIWTQYIGTLRTVNPRMGWLVGGAILVDIKVYENAEWLEQQAGNTVLGCSGWSHIQSLMGMGYNLGRHGRYRVTRHSTRLKHHETIPLKTWSRHFKVKLWYRWWMVNQFVTSNAPFTKIMQHTFKVLRLPPSNEVIFNCPHDNTLIATQRYTTYFHISAIMPQIIISNVKKKTHFRRVKHRQSGTFWT